MLAQGVTSGGTLWLRQAYTLSDFRFDGDALYGDNELPGAPRHYYRAELEYEPAAGIALSLNLEWVPRAYAVDNANTLYTRSYALLGLRAQMPIGEHWKLFLDARNLTNRSYISSTSVTHVASATRGDALFNPGEGRAVYVGLESRR